MATAGESFDLDPAFHNVPLRALNVTSRHKISQYLDLDGELCVCGDLDIVNNYNGLAELVGFTFIEIKNLMNKKSPTRDLLDAWTSKDLHGPTIGNLWKYLKMMERYDVLTDCKKNVERDCKNYLDYLKIEMADFHPEQDPTVSNTDMEVDETQYATVQDVIDPEGPRQMYDAFVCYSPEPADTKFVKDMLVQLEGKYGLTMFVPGRDDLPGGAKFVMNAFLIEKRCKRMIIIMTHQFNRSEVCDFNVRFAQALAPGARSKKLIPVLVDKDVPMPRILRFLAVCDFSKEDMREWVWERLAAAIKAPISPPNREDYLNTDLKSITCSTDISSYTESFQADKGFKNRSEVIKAKTKNIQPVRISHTVSYPITERSQTSNSGNPAVPKQSTVSENTRALNPASRFDVNRASKVSTTSKSSGYSSAAPDLDTDSMCGELLDQPSTAYAKRQGDSSVVYNNSSQSISGFMVVGRGPKGTSLQQNREPCENMDSEAAEADSSDGQIYV